MCFDNLTNREREVLNLICEGLSNREIALNLGIKIQTIQNHVRILLLKMGVNNRTQAAIKAIKSGQ